MVGLGEDGDDGDAGVTTDHGDLLVGRVGLLDLGDEAGGTDDVEGGDTEQTLGVVDALGLEDLGDDGDGRVDLCGGQRDPMVRNVMAAPLTGLEMTRMLALGEASAAALARSRTMEALVLKRSTAVVSLDSTQSAHSNGYAPSRVMPGLRGTPAGMRTISASVRASFRPEGVGS